MRLWAAGPSKRPDLPLIGRTVAAEVMHTGGVVESVLVGLFWFRDGSIGHSRGWPLYRLILNPVGIEVKPSTPAWLPFRGPRWSYAWSEIAKVERTRRGLRFRFADRERTFVVGTMLGGERLARSAQALCPDRFDPTIHTVTWWRWDPAE